MNGENKEDKTNVLIELMKKQKTKIIIYEGTHRKYNRKIGD